MAKSFKDLLFPMFEPVDFEGTPMLLIHEHGADIDSVTSLHQFQKHSRFGQVLPRLQRKDYKQKRTGRFSWKIKCEKKKSIQDKKSRCGWIRNTGTRGQKEAVKQVEGKN